MLFTLPRYQKRLLEVLFDCISAFLTVWISFSLRLEILHWPTGSQWYIYLLAPLLMYPIFTLYGLYQAIYRYNGLGAFITIIKAVLIYGLAYYFIIIIINNKQVPHAIGIMQPLFLLLLIGGSRAMIRYFISLQSVSGKNIIATENLLIYGAGSAGAQIANSLQRIKKYFIHGFIDDKKELQGRTINNIPIFSPEQAVSLIQKKDIKNILIAIPSASRIRRNEIVNNFRKYSVHIRTLPTIDELAAGNVNISDIKEVDVEDLLNRKPVTIDKEAIKQHIKQRVVMVTGAGGSIGSELCRQLISDEPSKLLLIDNAEHNLYSIHRDLEQRIKNDSLQIELLPLLCDVTEEILINEICRVLKPNDIYHAAAYKHVPMVELNPVAGIRNNVFGTLNITKAAIRYGVENFVLVSTDKAVRPTNVMGATKRLCEMIIQAYADTSKTTCFSAVRFGNVLASSGSVLPTFRRQIQNGGPITITHKEVTRYFMTIHEATQLVIQAGVMASGGDIFLLDMGEPVKIIDLALNLINLSGLTLRDEHNPEGDIEIEITGLRPGEKLYEELLIDNNPENTNHSHIYKSKEQFVPWSTLQAELAQLSSYMKKNDIGSLKCHLKKLIPEYQPNAATTDLLAVEKEKNLLPDELDKIHSSYTGYKTNGIKS